MPGETVDINRPIQGGWAEEDPEAETNVWAIGTGAERILDSEGAAIDVDDDVTITGTIVSVNPRDRHFANIEVQLSLPTVGPLANQRIKLHMSQVTKAGG